MPSPGPDPRPASGVGPGHPRRQRRQRGLHGADLLRPDDLEAGRLGRARDRTPIARMARALREYQVLGIRTTIPFFLWLMRAARVLARAVTTRPTSIACSSIAQGRVVQRADARRRGARVDRGRARRVPARDAAGRAVASAGRMRQRAGSERRAARRCADDVRRRGQRPQPDGLGRARRAGPLPGRSSTASRTWSTRCASAASDCRCCSTATTGSSREVQVARRRDRGEMLVTPRWPDGRCTVDGRRTAGGRACGRRRRACRAASRRVVAPMPAASSESWSSPGDEVAARQAVVVVEAMKMENELRSPKAGRVKEVAVSAGTPVEAGRVLVRDRIDLRRATTMPDEPQTAGTGASRCDAASRRRRRKRRSGAWRRPPARAAGCSSSP